MTNNKLMNVILCALIAGIIAALGTFLFIDNKYDAVSKVSITNSNIELPLAKELKTEEIVNSLIESNDWKLTSTELMDAVQIEQDDNIYLLRTSFNNKEDSVQIANQYAEHLVTYFNGYEISVDELSNLSSVSNQSILPKVLYISAGVLIGVLIGILINVMRNPNNKRTSGKRPESITKYPVLGTIKVY